MSEGAVRWVARPGTKRSEVKGVVRCNEPDNGCRRHNPAAVLQGRFQPADSTQRPAIAGPTSHAACVTARPPPTFHANRTSHTSPPVTHQPVQSNGRITNEWCVASGDTPYEPAPCATASGRARRGACRRSSSHRVAVAGARNASVSRGPHITPLRPPTTPAAAHGCSGRTPHSPDRGPAARTSRGRCRGRCTADGCNPPVRCSPPLARRSHRS